jgi:hypothetical protein
MSFAVAGLLTNDPRFLAITLFFLTTDAFASLKAVQTAALKLIATELFQDLKYADKKVILNDQFYKMVYQKVGANSMKEKRLIAENIYDYLVLQVGYRRCSLAKKLHKFTTRTLQPPANHAGLLLCCCHQYPAPVVVVLLLVLVLAGTLLYYY